MISRCGCFNLVKGKQGHGEKGADQVSKSLQAIQHTMIKTIPRDKFQSSWPVQSELSRVTALKTDIALEGIQASAAK
jgi:hypothetical protein